jgi:hypothetical protein
MPDALALLIAERDRLNQAIEILQGDAAPTQKRGPGRPPGSKNKPAKTRGRKPMTSADRKRVSERMKKYWAKRRKAAK